MIAEVEPSEVSPLEFVEGTLDLALYDWQTDALAPLEDAGYGLPLVQISVLAPNEGGKSSRVIAGAACYWLSVKNGKVGITTRDAKQLNEQIIPAIEAQIAKFEGWHSVRAPYYKVTTATGGTLIAFTTDDAARVEGLHGTVDHPLLWMVDEAKSVAEHILTGIDRCGYQALLYTSSGGLMIGSFYDSHYGKTASTFVKVRAGLLDCPHIAPEKVKRIIDKYGELHPFTRSSVFGEFMAQDDADEYCVSLPALISAIDNPPKHKSGIKAGFCDFGAGTAEHVLAIRDGNKVEIAAAWIEANKDATAGRFIREFRKAGFTADKAHEQLECDASDKDIWQKLANAGWTLRRRNFGGPPRLKKEYVSWGAEAWLEGAIKIGTGDWILPDDDTFKAQAISRKKGFTAAGKLSVEDKLLMAKRGVASPDRPDAVFGVMDKPEDITQKELTIRPSWREHEHADDDRGVLASIGADAGY